MFGKFKKALIKRGIKIEIIDKYIDWLELKLPELNFINREIVIHKTCPDDNLLSLELMDFGEWNNAEGKLIVYDILEDRYLNFDNKGEMVDGWMDFKK